MNKNGKYLVAVSGGPDSMALLDMMKNKGVQISVAHVNYHRRDTALRDEKIVKKYCKENNIKVYKLDVREYKGNFQDYARVARYKFFADIVNKNKLDGLLVAHHLDDYLETYLMQLDRGSIPNYYGLNKKVELQGITVYRPLLNYTKKDLEDYCIKNNIPYGIDESNLTNHYKRNRIRHDIIEKYTLSQKKALKKEAEIKNKKEKEVKDKVAKYLKGKTKISFESFVKYQDKENLIRFLIKEDLSSKYLKELINQLLKAEKLEIKISNQIVVKEYGYIEVFDDIKGYEYKLKEIEYKKYPYFKVLKKGNSFEGVTVSKKDFPLIIRSPKKGDSIKMLYGTKKLNRFFIDKKVPTINRKKWPVIVNKNEEIILVPGIGCNASHYSIKHNLFVVKL